MKIEISVPEVVSVFKEIQTQPEKVFEMIRLDVREAVGKYLSEMMNAVAAAPSVRKEMYWNSRSGEKRNSSWVK